MNQTESNDLLLGSALGSYIVATLIVEGYTEDKQLWQNIQTQFLEDLQDRADMPAEDIARIIQVMSVELKAKLKKGNDGAN